MLDTHVSAIYLCVFASARVCVPVEKWFYLFFSKKCSKCFEYCFTTVKIQSVVYESVQC